MVQVLSPLAWMGHFLLAARPRHDRESYQPAGALARTAPPRDARSPPDTDRPFHAPRSSMKAVVLVGGLTTTMRPMTLTLPLPLLPFVNKPLIMHQLQALKEAGATEVIFCINSRSIPKVLTDEIEKGALEFDVKVSISQEKEGFGTAGSLKFAEALITADGTNDAPFFVVNSDVLCSYPLRDLLHVHMKLGRVGTMLTTRSENPSNYGVAVIYERTGTVKHFVANPQVLPSRPLPLLPLRDAPPTRRPHTLGTRVTQRGARAAQLGVSVRRLRGRG